MTEFSSPDESTGAVRADTNWSLYLLTALVFAISAVATIHYCRTMSGGMDMPGGWTMSMMWMRMPGQSWAAAATMFLEMWMAMMVAMMLPSALPMLLRFRRFYAGTVNSRTGLQTLLVACGYLTVWLVIGVVIYVIGVFWADATMQWSRLSQAVPVLIGATVALAGLFQFSRWKMYGLGSCRHPSVCSISPQNTTLFVGYSYGIKQGLCCAICCSGPMLILLALGMMSLVLMIAVTALISLEKLLANPFPVVRIAGFLAVVGGLAGMIKALL